MRMPFGRYYGVGVSDLPDEYLDWLRTRDLYGDLHDAVEHAEANQIIKDRLQTSWCHWIFSSQS